MTRRRDYAELLRVVGVSLAVSLFAGLVCTAIVRPPLPLATSLAGYTLMFGTLFVGFSLGEHLDLERRRGNKRWDMILVLLGVAVVLALVGYAIGLQTPPLVGHSENQVLWPSFVLIGLLGGALGNQARFQRK
jgi:O-antigen/teichoic acid export membrane protein